MHVTECDARRAIEVTRLRAGLAGMLRRAADRLSAVDPVRQRDGAVITPYPSGPYLVRGAYRITDIDGNEIDLPRRTVALCRCGLTGSGLWCDGSHKAGRRTAGHVAMPGPDGSPALEEATAVGSRGDDGAPVPAAAGEQSAAQSDPRAGRPLQ